MKKEWEGGFSLIEVMIAVTLFTIFASAYLVSQGYNMSDSAISEEQLKLHMLCERQMNEILINPPRFTNALENLKETKTFEDEEYANYSYTTEWKRLIVPDFGKIFASQLDESGSEENNDNKYADSDSGQARNKSLETIVFEKLKENLEKILWQVRLTVTNKETKYSYSLSRWVSNNDEPVQLNLNF